MCGIVGVLSTAPLPESLPIAAMRDTLRHRGPDDAGLWWSADRRVAFGHRRLSIIDLSPAGHQPMSDAAGELWIVFNGEIYNFVELRAELEGHGHAFRSHSDTEVVLAAYRQWGSGMLARLNGMFAFALYDAREQKVLLARDRAGEKPLYVSLRDGTLRFASELKALMADPAVERRVNLRALDLYLTYAYVPADLCILEGVEKLRAGHAMTFDLRSGAASRWAYWSLPPAPPDVAVDEEELDRELESLLEDAVRRQMLAADVPVGILLSGGLDSSLITAMAARAVPRVNTFTISFPGHGTYDESPHARLVAEHFGTNHVVLPASTATVSLLPELARQYDEPMADSSMIPTFLVSRLIREQATVALGGDGGDELFGGYPHYNWLLRQVEIRRFVPRPLARVAYGAASALLPVGLRGRNFVLGLTAPQPLRLVHANSYFDERTRRALLANVCPVGRNGHSAEGFKLALVESGIAPVDQATRLDFRTYLTDDILVKVDRASMLTSLEVRAPFLDHRIIELAFGRVPARLKATRGDRKILLRKFARRVLPPGFDVERKQGFSIPLARWFSGEWGDAITSVLRSADSIFDRGAVEALIEGQKRGRSNGDRLFALTLFELWRREYRVSI
jgi:asparagine synthase (glutamine-hydrolysing)